MKREARLHVQGANLTAVMSHDTEGFSAIITGNIIDAPWIRKDHYGPVTVRAPSLEELKRAVEDKLENDGLRFIRWLDE